MVTNMENVSSVSTFLGDFDLDKDEIKHLTTEYKNNPDLAIEKIIDIANRKGIIFSIEDFKLAVIPCKIFKANENNVHQYQGERSATLNGSEINKFPTGEGHCNEVIYEALEFMNDDFLKNL